jgi:alkanesulfonate monooxygenase SsuD/methylene tetrahydromethanopterin reductase-like flavin-dependent oxidoreductase (luciferase family)
VLNVGGVITDGASAGMFRGPVQQWVDELAQMVEHGFDTFVFSGEPAQLARFAEEVVPAARELVAAERGR